MAGFFWPLGDRCLPLQAQPSTRTAKPSQPPGPFSAFFLLVSGFLTRAAVFFPGLDGVLINLNKHRQSSWLVGGKAWAGGPGQHCIICGHLWLQESKPSLISLSQNLLLVPLE